MHSKCSSKKRKRKLENCQQICCITVFTFYQHVYNLNNNLFYRAITERSLKNMFMVHKRIDDQLAKTMSSINLAGEENRKLVEENNSNLTKMISLMELLKKQSMISPNSVPITPFFSENLLSKFILRLFQSGRLKGEIHICPVPTFYPDFVQKLGEFCYRSPKKFCSSVDKVCIGLIFIYFY